MIRVAHCDTCTCNQRDDFGPESEVRQTDKGPQTIILSRSEQARILAIGCICGETFDTFDDLSFHGLSCESQRHVGRRE